jgi:hypothetical protein
MKTDADRWLDLAHRLGIEIVAPFNVELAGVQMHFTALLPQFGATSGMVIDANWVVIEPHLTSFLAAGYGFSCVGPGDAADDIVDAHEMLSDWGWTSASPKPDWLRI